jgi:predicted MFS family arabinose efflux permease
LANTWGWHTPFLVIAGLSAIVGLVAWWVLPRLEGHLAGAAERSTFSNLVAVLAQANHWRAMGLTVLVMSAGFCIIPYITIYAVNNLGVAASDLPLIYFTGGVATLFSARLWGVLTDRWGKVPTFRVVTAGAIVPMLTLTHLPPVPMALYLVVTTLFFMFVSGRMIPSMAIITSATTPALRGTFMTLNSSVQSGVMGVAALIGGHLISRDSAGHVQGYGWTGWLSAGLSVLALMWVTQVRQQQVAVK